MGSLLAACGIWFSDQGSNPGPLHREHGILATAPPGRSLMVPACLCRCTSHYSLVACLHAEKLFSIYVSLTAHVPFFYSILNIYFLMLFVFDSFFQTKSLFICETFPNSSTSPFFPFLRPVIHNLK